MTETPTRPETGPGRAPESQPVPGPYPLAARVGQTLGGIAAFLLLLLGLGTLAAGVLGLVVLIQHLLSLIGIGPGIGDLGGTGG